MSVNVRSPLLWKADLASGICGIFLSSAKFVAVIPFSSDDCIAAVPT
jgi:hypothetical protein